MEVVILVIVIIVAVAMVVTILLQKSEGGALGIGGSSAGGGMMKARGQSDTLSRATKWLAVVFLSLTLALNWLAQQKTGERTAADIAQEEVDNSGEQQLPELPTIPDGR